LSKLYKAVILHTRGVQGSNLGPETSHPHSLLHANAARVP